MTKPYFSALFALLLLPSVLAVAETVTFPSGEITLHGVLYKPAGIECLGRSVYWRSDRGCRESRRPLCGCRNDGAVERSVRSPSVVAKTEFRSIESHRGGGKLVWWRRNCAGSRTRRILCGDRFCGGRSELGAGS